MSTTNNPGAADRPAGNVALPRPGWYPDPQTLADARWWDGGQWTAATAGQEALSPPPTIRTVEKSFGGAPSDAVHWMLPTGRSWQSIAAGYVGLISLLIWPLGPLAIILGVWGLVAAGRSGTHGRIRATFGVITGIVGTFFFVVVMTASN